MPDLTIVQFVPCAPYRTELARANCVSRWRAGQVDRHWGITRPECERCQRCGEGERRAKGEPVSRADELLPA